MLPLHSGLEAGLKENKSAHALRNQWMRKTAGMFVCAASFFEYICMSTLCHWALMWPNTPLKVTLGCGVHSGKWQQVSSALMTSYLSGEEAAHTDDAEDVEDGRAHDGPHTHVTFGDEHPWGEKETHTQHYDPTETQTCCTLADISSRSTQISHNCQHK